MSDWYAINFLNVFNNKNINNISIIYVVMKEITKDKVIYAFSKENEPVDYVKVGEPILFHTEDALGGQIKSEADSLSDIDWSRVNPATGPIYIEGADEGDTLVVNILDVEVADRGICLVVPGYGALGKKKFESKIKIVEIDGGYAHFNNLKIRVKPVIGTIGVAPYNSSIPTGVPYKHGGNLDCTEITKGVKLYLPVATKGALFAVGDLHAVQADGELCVASIEVSGKVLLKFDVLKGMQAEWPIVETENHYSILVSDESLDKAVEIACREAVKVLQNKGFSFEDAYMLSSLIIDVAINQVVDPKKGVRAIIPKEYITIDNLFKKKD